ncbi:unnamed protein product [Fusarium graminearum]|uniref:Chromosome 3, complete genome n=1 Tax=Gibberella zeae (strain ATCC MYA-4620 / CBS 123657 / FGSC 9075 / NRRL 31084 / PH-1) TaxID=229533 RepID=A0A1C3YJL5_GIBZE|nr:unnamed protein product [Fusarium graminearum]
MELFAQVVDTWSGVTVASYTPIPTFCHAIIMQLMSDKEYGGLEWDQWWPRSSIKRTLDLLKLDFLFFIQQAIHSNTNSTLFYNLFEVFFTNIFNMSPCSCCNHAGASCTSDCSCCKH